MYKKMDVIAVTEPMKVEILKTDLPKVEKGKILVKISHCAICTFEQRVFSGKKNLGYPYVGGHELSGYIEEIGEDVNQIWKVGQKVALKTISRCGECYFCRTGNDSMCEKIGKMGRQIPEFDGIGGLAQYFIADPSWLFKLEDDVDMKEASLIEPVSCVLQCIDKSEIDFGEYVVIVGAGIMGMLNCEMARLRGACTIVVEPDEARRLTAKEKGANYVINPADGVVESIMKLTKNQGVDVVIYTLPFASLLSDYTKIIRNNGRILLYGSFNSNESLNMSLNDIHYKQIKIIGVVNPSQKAFERAVRMINEKLIDLSTYVNNTYDYKDAQEAFSEAVSKACYRIIIRFDN